MMTILNDIICVNVCVIIILLLIQNSNLLFVEGQKIKAENNNTYTNPNKISSVLTDLFNRTENSVVQITSQSNATLRDNVLVGQTTASGSGFVYDNQGHIFTNDNVIKGHKIVDVKFADGNTFNANSWEIRLEVGCLLLRGVVAIITIIVVISISAVNIW